MSAFFTILAEIVGKGLFSCGKDEKSYRLFLEESETIEECKRHLLVMNEMRNLLRGEF